MNNLLSSFTLKDLVGELFVMISFMIKMRLEINILLNLLKDNLDYSIVSKLIMT